MAIWSYFLLISNPSGGSKWILSVGDYVNNSFTALGSSDPREVSDLNMAILRHFLLISKEASRTWQY